MEIYEVLKRDHQAVKQLFKRLEKGTEDRETLFDELYTELSIHSEIEDEVFYSVLEKDKEIRDLILEGKEEHKLITQKLEEMSMLDVEDEEWQAKLTVLQELVEHHVEEEEGEMFKKARKVLSNEQAHAIAEEFEQNKHELVDEL